MACNTKPLEIVSRSPEAHHHIGKSQDRHSHIGTFLQAHLADPAVKVIAVYNEPADDFSDLRSPYH